MMGNMDGSSRLQVIFQSLACLDVLVGNLEIGMFPLCTADWVTGPEIDIQDGRITMLIPIYLYPHGPQTKAIERFLQGAP